jgi:L-alanine-DL-glutamate epimerase-like enolase superfamily enzyme
MPARARLRSSTIEATAGECGYGAFHFHSLLKAGAVDVPQADATRCYGYTGFLWAAALADAYSLPQSAHTASALHLQACCGIPRLRHIEWFHDHAYIEAMLFGDASVQSKGVIRPDLSRPGHGLEFRCADAQQLKV